MVCDTGSAVQRSLVFGKFSFRPKAAVGVGAGIEEEGGCADEVCIRLSGKPEVFGQAEVCQWIGAVRQGGCRGVVDVMGQEFFYAFMIGEDGGDVDVEACQPGVLGEHGICLV